MEQAKQNDPQVLLPPTTDQLSKQTLRQLCSYLSHDKIATLKTKFDLCVPLNMLAKPHALSFNDMCRIERLYMNEHIDTETFSSWFGINVPFIVSPVINANKRIALKKYSEIESENKKLLMQSPPTPFSNESYTKLKKLLRK